MVSATAMRTLAFLVFVVTVPVAAFGQPAIGGMVSDPSGAPMAGVLVEASSTALIEKTRKTLTDAAGRYRMEDLVPGTYRVRFTLQGWKPYQQEGVELAGSFTAVVNAELAVGSMNETITVIGEIPAIDVHRAGREITLSGDLVQSIPTARSYNAVLALIPGVLTNVNDTVTGTAATSFPIHGGRTNEGRLSLDGMTVGSPPSGNSATSYVLDVAQSQEMTFVTAGGLGESETAGLTMNIVPKSGGNAVGGSFFASGTGATLRSNNLTPELTARGVTAPTPLKKVYDVSGTIGGPILTDRLWYFVNGHTGGSTKDSASVYYNLNAGDPNGWLYAPDVSRREYSDRTFENASGRLTWQATPRNKMSGFWDAQSLCRTCSGATAGQPEPARVAPEAVGVLGRRLDVTQATWSSPITNRLIAEAGFSGIFFGVGNFERDPNPTRDLVRVTEQCASGCAANGNIPGLVYRSQDFSVAHTGSYLWKGSIAYVTGTHSLKIGYQRTLMTDDRQWFTNNQNLSYRFNNGVPNQLTQSISPWVNNTRVGLDALFVEEQWTRRRLTLQGAVRFDRARSWFPAQQEGPSRFLPTAIVIPESRGVDSYKDITPRMGVAYDVFGTGRTAIKMTIGKYLEGAGVSGNYANSNPSLRMPQTTSVFGTAGVTRAWTDTNGNFVPDCDLSNAAAQDNRASGGDVCGVVSNTDFGKNVLSNNFDPRLLHGWGVRPSDWNLGVTMQQQIGPRSSVDVTYSRRWFRGFSVVDNLALQPSDLTPFNIVAPLDPRLPSGGGYVVTGLYDVVPAKAGQVNNLVVDSLPYGTWYQYFNGLDVTINARVGRSLTVMAGTSTGQTVADNCDVRAHLPELATTATATSGFGAGLNTSVVTMASPYCHVAYGVLTQIRGLASYEVSKIGVLLAATFQSKPGAMLAANYAAPNSVVAPSLGRDLSGNAANVTVNLVPPGTAYGDRINQFDIRAAKTMRYGRSRTLIAFDVYNTLNSSAVLTYDNTFVPGGPWLQPLTILTPRFFKISVEIHL
jgi:Carboxypeptidase regulatory-like domain